MSELFEAFGIDWKLLLAQAVNFGIVLVALTYFLYRPIMSTLQKRKELIAKGIADAERATETFKKADSEVAEKLQSGEKEAERIVSAARAAAAENRSKMLQEAEARAGSITKDAEARAKETARKALRESEREVARLAVLAASKIMKKQHE